MKVAVIGATGLVGQKMLQVLDEQNLPIDELIVAASEKSVGKKIIFKDKEYTLISVDQAVEEKPNIAIFSAGAEVSLQYAKKFAANGTYVIDNTNAFRMREDVPLVVPEINSNRIKINSNSLFQENANKKMFIKIVFLCYFVFYCFVF